MLSFSDKFPISIKSGRQYIVSFTATVSTPCRLFGDFYIYPVRGMVVDGDDITIDIPESDEYTIILDAPKFDENDISNIYFRLWNKLLPRSCIQITNVYVKPIDGYTTKEFLPGIELSTHGQTSNELDIAIMSTWNCHCGIATYTKHLLDGLQKLYPSFEAQIIPVNDGVPKRVNSKIVHIQHEWGIFPKMPEVNGRCILTWHSVSRKAHADSTALGKHVDSHIVHSQRAKDALSLSVNPDNIYVIPHGSFEFPDISKQAARELLELPLDKFIVFVFGMRADFKGYDDLISIDNDNLLILVSSGPHGKEPPQLTSKYCGSLRSTKCTKFLNYFLSELQVTLYALAADAFLFNYKPSKNCISASGAFHRVVGAGRPIICTDVPQFDELDQNNSFKIKDESDIIKYINILMENNQLVTQMGESARKVASTTSWTKIARMHMELYT